MDDNQNDVIIGREGGQFRRGYKKCGRMKVCEKPDMGGISGRLGRGQSDSVNARREEGRKEGIIL